MVIAGLMVVEVEVAARCGPGTEGVTAYYCYYPPFPDGMDRGGSAGCAGTSQQGLAPPQDYYQGVYGGYFLNGHRC